MAVNQVDGYILSTLYYDHLGNIESYHHSCINQLKNNNNSIFLDKTNNEINRILKDEFIYTETILQKNEVIN